MIHVRCDGCHRTDALEDLAAFEAAGWTFTKPRGVRCRQCNYVSGLQTDATNMVQALHFYADQANWRATQLGPDDWDPAPVQQDHGKVAQDALAEATGDAS